MIEQQATHESPPVVLAPKSASFINQPNYAYSLLPSERSHHNNFHNKLEHFNNKNQDVISIASLQS